MTKRGTHRIRCAINEALPARLSRECSICDTVTTNPEENASISKKQVNCCKQILHNYPSS